MFTGGLLFLYNIASLPFEGILRNKGQALFLLTAVYIVLNTAGVIVSVHLIRKLNPGNSECDCHISKEYCVSSSSSGANCLFAFDKVSACGEFSRFSSLTQKNIGIKTLRAGSCSHRHNLRYWGDFRSFCIVYGLSIFDVQSLFPCVYWLPFKLNWAIESLSG